jgi:hypothetical protein
MDTGEKIVLGAAGIVALLLLAGLFSGARAAPTTTTPTTPTPSQPPAAVGYCPF